MPAMAVRDAHLPLAGRRIVVTRPVAQAEPLATAIERNGGVALRFPVIEIGDVADATQLAAAAARIEEFDFAVFVSPNAIDKALGFITARRAWPARVRAVAMGRGSERRLAAFGVRDALLPEGDSDSEALLRRPELQAERIRGRRVAIFRGNGGRELLGDTLTGRGARVERVECYRRDKPEVETAPLLGQLAAGAVDAIIVSSSEGLRNLCEMLGAGAAERLRRLPLFLQHQRIAAEARRLGFTLIVSAASGDDGLLAGLIAYFGGEERT
jgi:uroporphyrinogen-III synthase